MHPLVTIAEDMTNYLKEVVQNGTLKETFRHDTYQRQAFVSIYFAVLERSSSTFIQNMLYNDEIEIDLVMLLNETEFYSYFKKACVECHWIQDGFLHLLEEGAEQLN